MRIHLQPSDSRPLYVQIMDEVRRGLARGGARRRDFAVHLETVREVTLVFCENRRAEARRSVARSP
jgi:DNA-binding transcriptional regulator YhcF (GntR family)